MSKVLSIEEIVDSLSEGLPPEQRQANYDWLEGVYQTLKDGGTLGIPNTGQLFTKKSGGFVEIVPVER